MATFFPKKTTNLEWLAVQQRNGKKIRLGWFATKAEADEAQEAFNALHPRIDSGGLRKPCVHPSRNCYDKHGCRCQGCKDVNAERSRKFRRDIGSVRRNNKHDRSIEDLWMRFQAALEELEFAFAGAKMMEEGGYHLPETTADERTGTPKSRLQTFFPSLKPST